MSLGIHSLPVVLGLGLVLVRSLTHLWSDAWALVYNIGIVVKVATKTSAASTPTNFVSITGQSSNKDKVRSDIPRSMFIRRTIQQFLRKEGK